MDTALTFNKCASTLLTWEKSVETNIRSKHCIKWQTGKGLRRRCVDRGVHLNALVQ